MAGASTVYVTSNKAKRVTSKVHAPPDVVEHQKYIATSRERPTYCGAETHLRAHRTRDRSRGGKFGMEGENPVHAWKYRPPARTEQNRTPTTSLPHLQPVGELSCTFFLDPPSLPLLPRTKVLIVWCLPSILPLDCPVLSL
jgi:hypothetical protein